MQNDILQAVDSRGGAILVLFDLSAVFDTIAHEEHLIHIVALREILSNGFIISERPCSMGKMLKV